MTYWVIRSAPRQAALALGLVVIGATSGAPPALAGPAPCQTKNVRTGVEYKGTSAFATALAAAATGDTINVWGSCPSNARISSDVTLRGKGKNATLDGGKQGRVLRIGGGTTTIRDLTITNGKTTSLGGGIYVGSAAVLVGVQVSGNEAGANNFGGGIEADAGSQVTLVNSTVSGNTAGGSGGIDMFSSTVSLTNSIVSGNHATGATIDGCAFDGGIFSCAGGIWNYHGRLALVNSRVTGNDAAYRAGGIRNDATFSGGVPQDGITVLSGSSTISSNTAGNQGGGIWASGRVQTDPGPPPVFAPFSPNGSVQAANGTASYTDPITASTLPAWTGSIAGNSPDECFPTLTIGSLICG
ncbi:MAG TPA: hypothetical protein VH300_17055 [Thermoleophilaceae bacterium]|jgi:hypothetical protein|nr:hypothetical protein [Thermoleophilaceae bacterium]